MEVQEGFRESDLSKQSAHRYKIYIEGRGWSVSEKYILACDSVAEVPRLLLAGADAAAALLAHPRPRQMPLHKARRGLGQRSHGQGDRREREQVHPGGADDGPCLRLHASPSDGVREAATVQARGASRGRGEAGKVGAGEAVSWCTRW